MPRCLSEPILQGIKLNESMRGFPDCSRVAILAGGMIPESISTLTVE
jgi:hypothetical protein